ncbi:MAG TPA: hypothetical protein DIC59_10375 [Candidatus Competibacteraceae bacterium]|nr:hypothetical protein [Candidatus Competibacteraceae bacterium]
MRPLYSIDLKLLRAFDTVVKCGGFSAAQAMLNISQSMISEYMGQLEIRLGAKLCERGRCGFRLTEAGAAYHAALQQLFEAIDQFGVASDVLRNGTGGKLHLGIIDNTTSDPLSPIPPAIQCFTSQNPHAHIAVQIGVPNELEVSVLDRRLHLAIGYFPVSPAGEPRTRQRSSPSFENWRRRVKRSTNDHRRMIGSAWRSELKKFTLKHPRTPAPAPHCSITAHPPGETTP